MTDRTLPPPVVWLPMGRLSTDQGINRPLDRHRVATIARELDPDAIGVLTVSARDDVAYVVLDGQHRLAALRKAGWDDAQQVPCDVRRGLTRAEEAGLFVKLNESARPRHIHRFLRRITAGDPVAVRVAEIAAGVGFEIADQHGDGRIKAAAALERVYLGPKDAPDRGPYPQVLADTLQILSKAYGHTADAVQRVLIEGVGLLLHRYGEDLDTAALAAKLAKQETGPNGLIGKARTVYSIRKASMPACVAEACVSLYNQGRRGRGRLAAWT